VTTYHLKKKNSPESEINAVEWICTYDKEGLCTDCRGLDGKASSAFIGTNIDFIDQWLTMGVVDGVNYHEIISIDGKAPEK